MFVVLGKHTLRAALAVCITLTVIVPVLLLQGRTPSAQETLAASHAPTTVWVLDAGHGGEDGGAVAADGTKESEINLALTERLEVLLALLGEQTRMTRTGDVSLHSDGAATTRQRKSSDLRNRAALVEQTPNAVLVSIHQNSLPSHRSVHGAQVFYGAEEGGAELAQTVQTALNRSVNIGNEKQEKAIDPSVFLMKNVTTPAILIECGFLSNSEETAALKSAVYQKKLAVVITSGLLQRAQ